MTFANPQILWLMPAALPLLVWFLWVTWRRKQRLVAQFVQSRLLAQLTVGVSRGRQKLRLALLVFAVGGLWLALAGPRWGFDWEEARQRGLDVVIAVDTSRSMLAQDMAPDRLTRAKLAALDLLRLLATDRLGLVAFAGTAFLQCPLTLDDGAFRQSVDLLQVGVIPQGGTALTEAMRVARSAFKDELENEKVLVLFSDGEDHDSGALAAAEEAARAGLRIYTVGVGTEGGELLRQRDEQTGQWEFIKDEEGNAVKSRLNEGLLQQIATAGRGFYVPLRGAGAVEALYRDGLATLKKSETASRFVKRFHERYYWPLGLAVVLLVLELFVPDQRRVERTEGMRAAGNSGWQRAVAVVAALVWGGGVGAWADTALEKYSNRQYEAAWQEYAARHEKNPRDGRLAYNAGAAAYRAGRFDQAVKHWEAALATPQVPLPLQQRAYYNLGNALFRVGEQAADAGERAAAWEQAIKRYESALELQGEDADAKFNRDLVRKRLEELKKEQEKQPKQDPQQQPDETKEEEDQNQGKQGQQEKQDGSDAKDTKEQEGKEGEKGSQGETSPSKPESESADGKPESKESEGKPESKDGKPESKESEGKPESKELGKERSGPGGEGGEKGQGGVVGQMTPQQAAQLLDAQKGEEKALLFLPGSEGRSGSPRRVRDW